MSNESTGICLKVTDIIRDALSKAHGLGKPSFSSNTMNAYEARILKPTH